MELRPAICLFGQPYFFNSLQWNQDDQVAICLQHGIHIVTPTFVDLRSEEEAHNHVGLHELRKGNPDAPTITTVKNLPIQPSILITETYRSTRWSPTGLSKINGSPKPGEYFETCFDITPLVKEHVLGNNNKFTLQNEVDRFQTLCCGWSPLIIPDIFVQKPAIIALGNKAGEITLWSYHSEPGAQFCTGIQAHQSFVHLLEWSNWRIHENKFIAYLISTCVDGTSSLISVELDIMVDDTGKTTIQSVVATKIKTWFESDPSNITILSIWDDLKEGGKTMKVIFCKNARIKIGSIIIGDDGSLVDHWSEYYLQYSSIGLAGANWSLDGNRVHLYTYDCQCVILDVDDHAQHTYNASLSEKGNELLVNKMNQQWMVEQDKMDSETKATANAVVPKVWAVDSSMTGLFSAVLFTLRPELDMNYYTTSNQDRIYMGFILHKDRQETHTIKKICDTMGEYIKDPGVFFTLPIQAILHESLQYIIDEDDSKPMLEWFNALDHIMSEGQYYKSDDTLAKKLFCDYRATAARILVRVQLDLKNYDVAEDAILRLTNACQKAKSFLKQQFSATVLEHIYNMPGVRLQKLNGDDIVTILLLCDRILSQQEPIPFALEQIQATCQRLQSCLSEPSRELQKEIESATLLLDGKELNESLPGREKCPGCQELVTVEGDRLAICPSMHIWGCCSLTRRVLTSSQLRVCILCGEKSLIPEETKTSELLSELVLQECQKCIMCGSSLL
ncbi:hypothetical protein BDA99DRAFT_561397 [Phascolomyces articulosus]|uniref:Transcription factor IIIC 90kDa subunit N-terminal domain-containing protein n=1 Tax=Phascolomyces articulosus TaxID=60185 RepID=A0AAD5JWR8_9FUNG|nr:hypothetical protein BDA99DRAFT_561397 [Phascolomyces articulosus]